MPELSTEDLERLIAETRAIANVCMKWGQLDGHTAARAQERALEMELAERRG